MTELLVRDLWVSYDGEPVLSGFTCDFTPPGCYALMGASGVGKTTLLHTLAGLIRPERGDVGGFAHVRRALLFQEDRLLEHLTAEQNVELVSDRETARGLLEELGLGDRLDALPGTLSGGQRRRVALARCLAYGGDVLLLDEPFTGLDEQARAVACRVIAQRGVRVILSTHDRTEARLLEARIVSL